MFSKNKKNSYTAMWRDIERTRKRERLKAGPWGWVFKPLIGWSLLVIILLVYLVLVVSASVQANGYYIKELTSFSEAIPSPRIAQGYIPVTPTVNEQQIRRDCTYDALRYCSLIFPKGRDAILVCMVKNLAKLQAKCRRYFY